MKRQIFITEPDMRRLRRLVENLSTRDERIESLEQELDRAIVVDPEKIPDKVVTMNSRVRIYDLDRNVETVCTLVFPAEANAEQHRTSILAPLGTALLGYRAGQVVTFNAPGGKRKVKILAIEYQPEAAARKRVTETAAVEEAVTAA